MQDYRKLEVWQKAHKLALNVYAISAYLKQPEAWPIRDQVFRAAISIGSNIAEGRGARIPGGLRQVPMALDGIL
jgi:four helix bundle protein